MANYDIQSLLILDGWLRLWIKDYQDWSSFGVLLLRPKLERLDYWAWEFFTFVDIDLEIICNNHLPNNSTNNSKVSYTLASFLGLSTRLDMLDWDSFHTFQFSAMTFTMKFFSHLPLCHIHFLQWSSRIILANCKILSPLATVFKLRPRLEILDYLVFWHCFFTKIHDYLTSRCKD